MARITGIGGVFFKSRGDDCALAKWYSEHLGLELQSFGGAELHWKDDTAEDGGITVWHVAPADTSWFAPGTAPFMINYRVDDLAALLDELRAKGVEIIGGPESHENGKFAWILDPEGNKLELWEPMPWDDKNKDA